MRHRQRGRHLGRSSSHRAALLRNLASSLFLTERDAEFDANAPKTPGRIITTLHKAKEVRPLVEKCITIARKTLAAVEQAETFKAPGAKGTEAWKAWRNGPQWRQWADARAPLVAAQRRVLQLLGNRQAVQIVFDEIAPRMADRPGGYTRILRLAHPRLGDAGVRAIIEFVGLNDRAPHVKPQRPTLVAEGDEG